MKIFPFLSILLVLLSVSCSNNKSAKSGKEPPGYQIAFYNVENLFDTINQEGVNDGEFTPNSSKVWNTAKYQEKLNHIEQVLSSIDSNGILAGVALAEIENRGVLNDLVEIGFLKRNGFKIIHLLY